MKQINFCQQKNLPLSLLITGNVKSKVAVFLPAKRVLVEHVERGFVIGQGEIDETQTALLAVGVGGYVFGENLVACLYALEAPIFELCEGRRAEEVASFLLRWVFGGGHFRICDVVAEEWRNPMNREEQRGVRSLRVVKE